VPVNSASVRRTPKTKNSYPEDSAEKLRESCSGKKAEKENSDLCEVSEV
jgi:hypothetical protein